MSLSEKMGTAGNAAGSGAATDATVIGQETTVEGKVISKGSLRIEGRVKGEIYADDTVVVGPSGEIDGNIEAQIILVGGKVSGNVKASDKMEIQPQGNVTGDVFSPYGRLIIEEGARLEGTCAMTKDVQLSSASSRPKVLDATSKPHVEHKSDTGA